MSLEKIHAAISRGLSKTSVADGVDILVDMKQDLGEPCDLEVGFRSYQTQKCLHDQRLDLPSFSSRLVQLSIGCASANLCSPTLPILLLLDAFEVVPLADCEDLFSVVESNVAVWKEATFFTINNKNNLLRICNDLLRRLSRSQNTVFCGRILLFLADFFPFSERSGLNIISEFNLENSTVFSADSASSNSVLLSPLDADGIQIDPDEKDLRIDYALYCKFWKLQDFFRNPVQCYQKEAWEKLSSFTPVVLATFKSFKLDHISLKKSNFSSRSVKEDEYFAMYLTNQNLLQLQLSDSNFRRYILVQLLILFQYLQSSVKFKQESHVLHDDQVKWLVSSTEKVRELLDETPPDGERFRETVQHLLKREEQWNAWKNEGCPALIANDGGAAVNTDRARPRKQQRQFGDEVFDCCGPQPKRPKILMGNPNLTKLWNICPDNLEACAAPERDFLPSLQDFFSEAIEQMDPDMQIEDCYKKVNDGQWGWRALRLLAKKSPHFFAYGGNSSIQPVPEYLSKMMKGMAPPTASSDTAQEGKAEAKPHETVSTVTELSSSQDA